MAPFVPKTTPESGSSMSQAVAIRDRMLRGERMSWEEILSWAQSGNLELMGAAFHALTSSALVKGEIDGVEADRFLVTYLLSVLEGCGVDPEIFQMPPTVAAHELAHLYKHWRESASPSDEKLRYIRDELSRLYVSGNEKQRRRVVDGALEHILEDPSCQPDFEDWKDNPLLASAIGEAMAWIRGGT
jgi:hypothetical protein